MIRPDHFLISRSLPSIAGKSAHDHGGEKIVDMEIGNIVTVAWSFLVAHDASSPQRSGLSQSETVSLCQK